MNLPKISIITPSYNQGHFIEETILSVIGQNYPNLEYIIIDGGSTDNTTEIIKKYADKITYWVSEKDKGIYDAMNKGIEKSTSEWLYFLGTDDTLKENILTKIFIENNNSNNQLNDISNYHFIYGKVIYKQSKNIYGQKYDNKLLAQQVICHQAIFTHKKLFEKYGNFEIRFKACADYAFMIKCFGENENKNLFLDLIFAEYNETGMSSLFIDKPFLAEKNEICKKYLGLRANNEHYYTYLGNIGLEYLRNKELKKAIPLIWIAFKNTNKKIYWLKNTFYWLRKNTFGF